MCTLGCILGASEGIQVHTVQRGFSLSERQNPRTQNCGIIDEGDSIDSEQTLEPESLGLISSPALPSCVTLNK